MKKIDLIVNYLDELIPNPKCELDYEKDYELLIAVMLSAQSTDKRVNKVTKVLFNEYDRLDKLKNADLKDIEKIIESVGTYHMKAKSILDIANKLDGFVPNDRTLLESIYGVGHKTTNLVLAILYGEPLMAVDTHIARICKRLGLVNKKDNVLAIEKKLSKKIPNDLKLKFHLQMVLFGRYYCKAIKPLCNDCKLKEICKRDI